jgi:predicted metal-binding transcription factor (methanogenesis marker protein 9)
MKLGSWSTLYKIDINSGLVSNYHKIENVFPEKINYTTAICFTSIGNQELIIDIVYTLKSIDYSSYFCHLKDFEMTFELKGKEYSYLKNKLSEVLVEMICPVGKKIRELLDDKSYLEKILKEGTEKAKNLAAHNLKEIKNAVGFL